LLSAYQELCEVAREKKQLNEELKTLLKQGAEIEPGLLTAEVRTSEMRNLSYPKVVQVLGEEFASQLRSRVEPTVCRRLLVHLAPESATITQPADRPRRAVPPSSFSGARAFLSGLM
jgi:hypothetical protein